jgi:hypothetical protein
MRLQLAPTAADTGSTMRTFGFRTHVLLALAAAACLVLSLGHPWYAAAPPKPPEQVADIGDINAPLTGFFDGLERWLGGSDGVSAWQALDHSALGIAALAGVAAAGALLLFLPALQVLGRDLLRYGALGAFGIVAWRLFDPPGANGSLELRNGAFAGAGFALVLVVCGSAAAGAPLRRKIPQRTFVPPPPPPPWGSTGPPGS